MPKLDDISDFANRGLDALFPARRIGRQALLANTAGRLMAAQKDVTPEEYQKGMQRGAELAASANEVPQMWDKAITKAVMPAYAEKLKQLEEASRATPKNKGKFDPEGLDRETDGMKKGGKVKGWGKARGARKAKIY